MRSIIERYTVEMSALREPDTSTVRKKPEPGKPFGQTRHPRRRLGLSLSNGNLFLRGKEAEFLTIRLAGSALKSIKRTRRAGIHIVAADLASLRIGVGTAVHAVLPVLQSLGAGFAERSGGAGRDAQVEEGDSEEKKEACHGRGWRTVCCDGSGK